MSFSVIKTWTMRFWKICFWTVWNVWLCCTRADWGAGDFLDGLSVTRWPSVQGRRIGAAASSFLQAPPTAAVTRRPLRPRRPAAVYCDTHTKTSSTLVSLWYETLTPTLTDKLNLDIFTQKEIKWIMHHFNKNIKTNVSKTTETHFKLCEQKILELLQYILK